MVSFYCVIWLSGAKTRSGCSILKSRPYVCAQQDHGAHSPENYAKHMLNKEMSGGSQHGFAKGIVTDKSGDLL